MSRDEGFAVADVDTGKHHDPKFRRLWRLLRDEAKMNAAAVLYEAVQLESWAEGCRVTAEDAAPVWMPDITEPLAALVAVGLLDGDGRVPSHAWDGWFGPAYERREIRRASGAEGGRRKASNARATLEHRYSDAIAQPSKPLPVPSVPSVPTVPTNAREDDEPEFPLRQWLAQHGCHVREGDGYHRHLVTGVEQFGAPKMLATFEQLAKAGVVKGDTKGFVFGALDALRPKPNLRAVEEAQREDETRAAFDRRVAKTKARLAEMGA